MNIIIRSHISSGDFGEGWGNANKAADDLAAYKELTWLNDLQPLLDEGHNVDMDIAVSHDAAGHSDHTEVVCESPEIQRRAEALMTDENVIRQRFRNDMEKGS